jgi:hypothetical protein
MDISRADCGGKSLCWRSVVREVHPTYFEPEGLGWLRSFGGGLVTTCGLEWFGAPCTDQGKQLGLHGRISHIPAERVSVSEEWRGNEYVISLSGEMIEGSLFGGCLRLRRRIETMLGAKSLTLQDEVMNVGPRPAPHMMLYHCNLGFPVLGPESRLLAPSITVQPNTPDAERGKEDYDKADRPTAGYGEKVYEHRLASRRQRTAVALVNEECDGGFGVYLRFRTDQLPVFNQWKMMGRSEYVMGLEPGTNGVTGRAAEREKGRLIRLRTGQRREYELEVGVLDGKEEIAAMEKEIRSLHPGGPAMGSVHA